MCYLSVLKDSSVLFLKYIFPDRYFHYSHIRLHSHIRCMICFYNLLFLYRSMPIKSVYKYIFKWAIVINQFSRTSSCSIEVAVPEFSENFRKLAGKTAWWSLCLVMLGASNALRTFFSGNFLELLYEVIRRVILLWADWLLLTASELANIFSLDFSIIHFSCLKPLAAHLSYIRNSYYGFAWDNQVLSKYLNNAEIFVALIFCEFPEFRFLSRKLIIRHENLFRCP